MIVEHDMQVVMGAGDRITVLHYGEVLAEGSPAEIQQNPRVLEVYLKDVSGRPGEDISPAGTTTGLALPVDGIHTYYGKSHILHGCLAGGRRRRGGRPARAERGRQEHHVKAVDGPGAAQPRRGAVRGPADRAAAAAPAGAAGHRLCAGGSPDFPRC